MPQVTTEADRDLQETCGLSSQLSSDIEQQQRYVEEIRKARLTGMHEFQSWFNESSDINQTIVRGYWDFSIHILTRKVCELIRNPEQKTALEIGYGGGRLTNAACGYFKEVIGIDIHDEQETVREFLRSQGRINFRLIKTSGSTIDIESESTHFIYSFIVLQHLPSFEAFLCYLQESYRTLKPGGVAQLYFGKYSKLDPVERLRYFIQGYKEIPDAPVNQTSLVMRSSKVEELSEKIGFRVVDAGTSYKNVPDGYPKVKGGQSYVTLLKRDKCS